MYISSSMLCLDAGQLHIFKVLANPKIFDFKFFKHNEMLTLILTSSLLGDILVL